MLAARSSAGFTLIELIIVVSVSIILMLAATAMFMTFLISNTKTSSIQLIRNEGSFALSQMEFLLRNAHDIETVDDGSGPMTCQAAMTAFGLKMADDGVTVLSKITDSDGKDKIASNSVFLTSGAVDLIAGPTFNCEQSADNLIRYVTISFTLRKGTPGIDQPRDIVEQTFTGGVQIRSY